MGRLYLGMTLSNEGGGGGAQTEMDRGISQVFFSAATMEKNTISLLEKLQRLFFFFFFFFF